MSPNLRKRRGYGRSPSLADDLLSLLVDHKAPYRITYRLLEGRYASIDRPMPSHAVLRATLSRLKKNGLVDSRNNYWMIVRKGIDRLRSPERTIRRSAKTPAGQKNMIILFDIPELEKRKRAWLRAELTLLGFVLLQKSAWFGPGPLPKEFIKKLHSLEILPYLKFFTATESNVV